jgi:hypothetical protein
MAFSLNEEMVELRREKPFWYNAGAVFVALVGFNITKQVVEGVVLPELNKWASPQKQVAVPPSPQNQGTTSSAHPPDLGTVASYNNSIAFNPAGVPQGAPPGW